jgi:hypothetical protein
MDQQKKQKVLLAVLGVFVLGAGTYFVAFRGSGASTQQAMTSGPVERRQREAPAEEQPTRTARRSAVRREAPRPATVERRERSQEPREAAGRRQRGRGAEDRTKKKTIAPAA